MLNVLSNHTFIIDSVCSGVNLKKFSNTIQNSELLINIFFVNRLKTIKLSFGFLRNNIKLDDVLLITVSKSLYKFKNSNGLLSNPLDKIELGLLYFNNLFDFGINSWNQKIDECGVHDILNVNVDLDYKFKYWEEKYMNVDGYRIKEYGFIECA
jgi:hypothetical protein